MKHLLPKLPYKLDALEPHLSAETLEYHYGKHHKTYIETLNKLVPGTQFENLPLESIVANSPAGSIFNNAAQAWNHAFYWQCMSPEGGGNAGPELGRLIKQAFGSQDRFIREFNEKSQSFFGAGWTWLVMDQDGRLAIETLGNAGNPITHHLTPILTCDLWEHAYYVDYRNKKAEYFQAFWKVVNWEFAERNCSRVAELAHVGESEDTDV